MLATDSLAIPAAHRQDLPERAEEGVVVMTTRTAAETGTVALDGLSRQIIEQLQQDGRRAYATIAKAVGLSEAAVHQRVQRLSDAGVIQIVAVTDPMQVGLFRQALVAVNVQGPIEPVADALAEIDEVAYVVICAGRFDVLCEVVCEDDAALLDLISRRVRALPGVAD